MNSSTSSNPGAGGSTGDLWKKVLDEVQTEAAARRNKIATKAAGAPARTGAELDLLKRILTIVEAKAAPTIVQAPPDRSAEILAQFLPQFSSQLRAELQSLPKSSDSSPLIGQIIDALKSQPRLEAKDVVAPVVQAIESQQPVQKIEQLRDDLSQQAQRITSAIQSLPKPVDATPQWQAVLDAIRNQPTVDPAAITAPLLEAIANQKPVDVNGPLGELASKIEAQLSALPRPVDATSQLQAILQAIQSLQAPQSMNDDALAQRIIEAIERAKPADVRDDLAHIRSEIAAIPRPADATAKLDELLAAIRHRPDDGRDELLLQILEAAQKPAPNHAESLARISEQLATLSQAKPDDGGQRATAQAIDQLHAVIAAQPKPADLSPQLQAILEAVQAQPRVDFEALVQKVAGEFRAAVPSNQEPIAQLSAELQRISESDAQLAQRITQQLEALAADRPNPALDEILSLLRAKATQSDEALLWRILQAVEQPPKNGAEKAMAAQTELLQQIQARLQTPQPAPDLATPLREELAAQTAQLRGEIGAMRDSFQQEITRQQALVREDLLNHSIEVIDQVKSQSPAALDESLRQIRAAIASLPKPVDPAPHVAASLDAILAAIRSQPQPQPVDIPTLVAEIRNAMPQPLSLATLPVTPSYKSDFARQEEMLRQLMVEIQMQNEAGENPATDAIAELRGELKSLSDANRRTQHLIEQSLTSAATKLESRLESKLNSGLAKIELAVATADTGRPPSLNSDTPSGPASPTFSYSWMSQPAPRSRNSTIAMTVTAVAAVGVFLVLLINALSGNGNDNPTPNANTSGQLAVNGTNAGNKSDPTKTSATTPVGTPTINPNEKPAIAATGDNKTDKGPIKIFHDPTGATGEKPLVATPIVDEIRNLTNPGARTRVVYELPQAKQIVFLVHASGGSATALTTILAELKKNLALVKPSQKFTVVISEGKRFIEAPPLGLREGSDGERSRVETWIDLNVRSATVRAATNPLVAIDVAISYSPDLLWIVSDGLAGDGIGHVSSKEILERIATLNPDGAIRIAATQVGSPDAAATLKALAEKYGGAYVVSGDGTSASRNP